jgi:hypothetical protein
MKRIKIMKDDDLNAILFDIDLNKMSIEQTNNAIYNLTIQVLNLTKEIEKLKKEKKRLKRFNEN